MHLRGTKKKTVIGKYFRDNCLYRLHVSSMIQVYREVNRCGPYANITGKGDA